MTPRKRLLRAVSEALGQRVLIWAGLRSDDVESIADLPQLAGSFSILGGQGRRASIEEVRFEDLTGVRVDADAWDIEEHLDTEEAQTFRGSILRALAGPSALLPYRASRFLSAIHFARQDRTINLGIFGGLQQAFEHKPWVESEIAKLGVPHVPWTYIADEEQARARDFLGRGPIMVRRSRTSGGEGLELVEKPEELANNWPHGIDAFAGVAPFVAGALPINVGATVWHDGVSVGHPSVQLIGIPGVTTRRFGYCGNDFALAKQIDADVIDEIERTTIAVGRWMARHGYRGTFGVDFLLHDGVPLFTEVNPRFQGSTHAAAQLSVESGESCLILDHIAAMMGMDKPPSGPLREIVSEASPLSHIIIHWTGAAKANVDPAGLIQSFSEHTGYYRADVTTRPDLITEPGGIVARLTIREQVTSTGFELLSPWDAVLGRWAQSSKGRVLSPIEERER